MPCTRQARRRRRLRLAARSRGKICEDGRPLRVDRHRSRVPDRRMREAGEAGEGSEILKEAAIKRVFAALLAAAFATGAFAQGYPARPIRLVVPLVPGGNQDIIARAVADEAAKGLGQQIVVENRPGASAILGTQMVKAALPHGY